MFIPGKISMLMFSMLMAFTLAAHAADYTIDDDYLQNLSEEADKLEYMDKAKQEVRHSEQQEASLSPEAIANVQRAGNSLHDFERMLLAEYPFSYQLYRRLDMSHKKQVFSVLQTSNKLSRTQHKIIELYNQTIN